MATWTYTVGSGYYYSHYQLTGNAQNVKEFLEIRGFSEAAIIGIIANMEHESYLNPGQQEHGYGGDPKRGYGLVQWTPADTKIIKFAQSTGANWYDGQCQMDYLMINGPESWIPTKTYPYTWEEYKRLTSIYDATAAFFYNFERGTWAQVMFDYASHWDNVLYGGVVPPVPPDPPTPPPSPTPVDDDWLLYIAIYLSRMIR